MQFNVIFCTPFLSGPIPLQMMQSPVDKVNYIGKELIRDINKEVRIVEDKLVSLQNSI